MHRPGQNTSLCYIFFLLPSFFFCFSFVLRRCEDMNKAVRWNMEPSDCEDADAPLPDLTVSGCIQGEAHLSEMANIGPSARLPLGTRLPLPHRVVPGSLHFQIGGSWTHIGHLSAPDASVRARPPVNYHLHRRKARRCRDVHVPDGWHCCVIIITLTNGFSSRVTQKSSVLQWMI